MDETKNLTNQRFGRWIVLETVKNDKNGRIYCKCKCDCGNEKIVYRNSLLKGKSQSCGCLSKELIKKRCRKDYTGQKFGMLTVEEMIYDQGRTKCSCLCDCGNNIIVGTSNLITGHTKSCGCETSNMIWNNRKMDLVGQRFGNWIVNEMIYNYNNTGQTYCNCVCSCGTNKYIYSGNLLRHLTTSCGCESTSIGEKIIAEILKKYNISYISQHTFQDCVDKQVLPFDFYIPNFNTCIEYQGIQHYKPIEHFGGQSNFEITIKHDLIKQNYCLNNNIDLVCLPYTLSQNEIEQILLNIWNP